MQSLRALTIRLLATAGVRVERLTPEGRRYRLSSHDDSVPLPAGTEAALRLDHPDLAALRSEYARLQLPVVTHSLWNAQSFRNFDPRYFRGDNAYVWQYRQWRNEARMKQYLAVLDVQSRDTLKLFDRLEEDGLFGVWRFQYGKRPPVSRDLVDSVNEINYLEQHVGLSRIANLRVLDIGAGYGRLAHRLCAALPQIAAYDCVDAVPESTWLCRFYLGFRGVKPARCIALHEHQQLHDRYDLAVNIHSFSECTLAAVRWWLDLVESRQIPWLLIVPNDPDAILSTEVDGRRLDLVPEIERRGYTLANRQPTYANDELREMIGVKDQFFLFKRNGQ